MTDFCQPFVTAQLDILVYTGIGDSNIQSEVDQEMLHSSSVLVPRERPRIGSLVRFWGIVGAIGFAAAGCAEPPVKPLSSDLRQAVTTLSADVSGIKQSDTSQIGARGSKEGGERGAALGAAAVLRQGSLLALVLSPVGAAIGSASGAAEARSEQIVDVARSELRLAMQDVDFGEDFRSRLATSRWANNLTVVNVSMGAASAAQQSVEPNLTGKPPYILALEYQVTIFQPREVNPKIAIATRVTAQLQSPDRRQLLHKATWTYCGQRRDFVEMSANHAALLRDQIKMASAILAEAIPYDLFISNKPRPGKGICMDFSDLPSGRGTKPPSLL